MALTVKEGAHAREPGIDAGGFEILRAQGSDPVEHEPAGDGRAVGERREPLKPLCVIVARGLRDFAQRAHGHPVAPATRRQSHTERWRRQPERKRELILACLFYVICTVRLIIAHIIFVRYTARSMQSENGTLPSLALTGSTMSETGRGAIGSSVTAARFVRRAGLRLPGMGFMMF